MGRVCGYLGVDQACSMDGVCLSEKLMNVNSQDALYSSHARCSAWLANVIGRISIVDIILTTGVVHMSTFRNRNLFSPTSDVDGTNPVPP